MKIMVTGGSGLVGRGVVQRLVASGHDVRVVDWKMGKDPLPGAEYVECDMTHFAALRETVRGMQAVVHLAAFPYPGAASGVEIFRVNCGGTYNVYEAAAQEGILRVATASSVNALGIIFGVKSFPIEYFPVDEEHPTLASDPYSFSKQTTEAIARYFWERDGISSTCLRMPTIYSENSEFFGWVLDLMAANRTQLAALWAMPEGERQAWLARMRAGLATMRSTRFFEKGFEDLDWNSIDFKAPEFFAMNGVTDFWSILSVEDAAQAFEKSLLADFEGVHPLFLCERENAPGVDSELLLRTFYPQVKARKKPLPGAAALLNYDRAAALIGFEPEYIARQRLK